GPILRRRWRGRRLRRGSRRLPSLHRDGGRGRGQSGEQQQGQQQEGEPAQGARRQCGHAGGMSEKRQSSRAPARPRQSVHQASAKIPIIAKARVSLSTMPTKIPNQVPTPTLVARPRSWWAMPRRSTSSPTTAPTNGPANTPTSPKNSPTSVPASAPITASRLAPTRLAPAAEARKSTPI